MLFELAARYFPPIGRNDAYSPSIIDVIPFLSHAELSFDDLQAWEAEFARVGELRYMNNAGDAAWNLRQRPRDLVQLPENDWADAMTAMRNYVTLNSDARVVIGGKTAGYIGRMPGISEEAFTSIALGKPLFVVGGFGGAAEPIARSIAAHEPVQFPSIDHALAVSTPNGLEERELQRLSGSAHIDEVALLITRGLRRLFLH
jgi:hypothetical protein